MEFKEGQAYGKRIPFSKKTNRRYYSRIFVIFSVNEKTDSIFLYEFLSNKQYFDQEMKYADAILSPTNSLNEVSKEQLKRMIQTGNLEIL